MPESMSTALVLAVAADIPGWLIAPFGLLLVLIAIMPLTPVRVKHLWERFYTHVAVGLGAVVVAYYLWRVPSGGQVVQHTAHEYFSFIALIGSLFVIAGGIHIKVKGESTPMENATFLLVGAVVANVIGTTGASMVLIRPWIRMNKVRISAYHVVFFIFIVSNVGGSLTPIGDPPLFLGFLRGVPFFWLLNHVVEEWLTAVALLILVFYVIDRRGFRRMPVRLQADAERRPDTWQFEGWGNLLFLFVVVGAVFLPAAYFLREIVMLGAAATSYLLTPKQVHAENAFTFAPIKEVAFLFVGIFATMMPALGYLTQHGQEFGFNLPAEYYFASGSLSAVLDNAPTYVNFLQLALTSAAAENPTMFSGVPLEGPQAVRMLLEAQPLYVVAVSLGAVFFGAMTYIGNGPNFMVKSIAHDAGVHCPTFFGYIVRYSLPILLPILGLIGWAYLL